MSDAGMVLSNLLGFRDRQSGALMVVFTAFVSVSTVVYAVLTAKLVAETRKVREVQTQPKVSVTARTRDYWINAVDLIVQNIGQGPAYDVRFEIEEDPVLEIDPPLSGVNFLEKGIAYFPPGERYVHFLTSMAGNYERKIKAKLPVSVTYSDAMGRKKREKFVIDFSQFIGMQQIGTPPLHAMADSLGKIQEMLRSAGGFGRIRVQIVDDPGQRVRLRRPLIVRSRQDRGRTVRRLRGAKRLGRTGLGR